MHRKLKRLVAGVAALATVGVTPLLTATAASAATLAGEATVKTAGGGADLDQGDANDSWTLRLPAGAACAADGNNGGRWHTYMIPGAEDPLTDLAFSGNGSVVGASTATDGTGTFKNNLYDTTGVAVKGKAPNLGDAAVINIPNMNHDVWTAGQIPSGEYNIGIACVDLDVNSAIDNLWNQKITVTYPGGDASGAQISWKVGVVAKTPKDVSAAAGNGKVTATFTPGGSDPADTGYTVEATDGTTTYTATGASSPIDVPVPNWADYTVKVKATNFVGDSLFSASSSAVSVPSLTAPVVTATEDLVNAADFTVAAQPATEPTPETYVVTVNEGSDGTGAAQAFTFDPATRAGSLTSPAPGSYLVKVTAQYNSGANSGPTGQDVAIVVSSTLLYQNVDVTRPLGALVLTQVCGSNGPLPAEDATASFNAVDAVPALNSSTVANPTTGGAAPTLADGSLDPNRAEYPYPTDADEKANPNYPTFCGIDLSDAKFITRGAGAGQYFAADGVINQVTVVDTTDADTGWSVVGKMSDFTANGGADTFSGSQLGWTPQVTEETAPSTDSNGVTYTPDANRGGVVHPNSPNADGLSAGRVLADANAGSGLGTTILDSRLKLLIPVTADAGDYTSTLTITATSKA